MSVYCVQSVVVLDNLLSGANERREGILIYHLSKSKSGISCRNGPKNARRTSEAVFDFTVEQT